MFFDNSLLKDHTGYILEIIVVFLQSAHFEKNKAVGFFVVVVLVLNKTVINICLQTKKLFKSYLTDQRKSDLN